MDAAKHTAWPWAPARAALPRRHQELTRELAGLSAPEIRYRLVCREEFAELAHDLPPTT